MSSKRKHTAAKPKNRTKSRKVEYDEEDISSEQDSEVDEAGSNADGEDAAVEDTLADVSSIPELPAPEVILVSSSRLNTHACLSRLDALGFLTEKPIHFLGLCIEWKSSRINVITVLYSDKLKHEYLDELICTYVYQSLLLIFKLVNCINFAINNFLFLLNSTIYVWKIPI